MTDSVNLVDSAAQDARDHWNSHPCGKSEHGELHGDTSIEFFQSVREYRYRTHAWLAKVIDREAVPGGTMLEIGHGIGTDLVRFASNGMEVAALDLSDEHHRLAQKNLELHGFSGDLRLHDASNIPFPDGTFDVVYSFGVLHHMQDPSNCISELHRVLKPGGKLIIGLYYKYSAFHLLQKLLVQGIRYGELKRLGYRGLLATIEEGADGIIDKPYVRVYSRFQVRRLLRHFGSVRTWIDHFYRDHVCIRRIYEKIPEHWEPALSRYFGWYVMAVAKKSGS